MQARVPISAADVARLLQSMGVDRYTRLRLHLPYSSHSLTASCVLRWGGSVVAVDLHCGQIQGFFGPRTPCDNLEGHVVALPYFQKLVRVSVRCTVQSLSHTHPFLYGVVFCLRDATGFERRDNGCGVAGRRRCASREAVS
jgi:phosphoribosylpyrophosphate synthetase